MKDKFTMSLVWHNCKTYPPKETFNNCLYVTDGIYITQAKYHREYGWIDKENGLRIQDESLHKYWWADLRQTIQTSQEFKEIMETNYEERN